MFVHDGAEIKMRRIAEDNVFSIPLSAFSAPHHALRFPAPESVRRGNPPIFSRTNATFVPPAVRVA